MKSVAETATAQTSDPVASEEPFIEVEENVPSEEIANTTMYDQQSLSLRQRLL